jgi:hypothetical protein
MDFDLALAKNSLSEYLLALQKKGDTTCTVVKLQGVYFLPGTPLKITSFFERTESKNLLDSDFFSTGPPLKQQSQRISWTNFSALVPL